ncbi:ATP-binding cassette domain-containing protein [Gordonia pseudamarae]|jgi:ATP-binding cassette subfamily B protein IrtA|uniref:Mycobactin import ATP-binding/permease protein IrtA n=1 Tax=Gordonia pseudamarae TaxID=2831662 RepID=A0ABX6ICQ0_9ACTN|nr:MULTISPECIES: ATP-binding cassette domain-containing protein [Gordonia]MBD0022890.1 ATP-binding cassette domain-containing protein [Gordonia sp. (in: high G+C Gram-positive bacteria)]QHN24750.1 ATP-binding cassette domain-containing protein [Gordonia pseudamarae]QHN33682.1 ATP-binding cassette domain-containing protein [Gordonia pseudamarae]
MSRGFNGALMRAFGARDHRAKVTGVQYITPHCRRVWFVSGTLFEEAEDFPTAFVRGWFPDGEGKEFQRGYTFVDADPETGEFSIDFVLHEPAGPASTWAATVEPGAEISFMWMSAMPFEVPTVGRPDGYLLIGDSASLPAIRTVVSVIPDDLPIELYLEEHDRLDHRLPLPEHPRLRVHWVPRLDATSVASALENRDWSNWYLWVCPESGTLKEVRKRAKEFGFPKSETHAQAYWAHGKAMGKERDPEAQAQADTEADTGDAARTAATEPEQVAPATASAAGRSAPATEPATPSAVQGEWNAAGAGRLIAPLKGKLIVAGLAQAILVLLQLAPFVLLVEFARRVLRDAPTSELWNLGFWALGLLGAGLLLEFALQLWLHLVDARFSHDLRHRLLGKMARMPLGWFTARNSGVIKSQIQDNTLALHYLVTHAVVDAVAAVVTPIAVLIYLFTVDWGIALCMFIPVLTYVVVMWRMMAQSGPKIPQAQKWAEHMNGEAAAYLEAQPVIRVFGGVMASSFRRNLDDYIGFLGNWQRPFIKAKTVMDLVTRPTTFLWLICFTGTLFVIWGWAEPVDLLPFLFLGTTFGARLLGIGYGLAALRSGTIAARDIQATLEEPELAALEAEPTAVTGTPVVRSPEVVFDRVTFGYRKDAPVLHDISLHLAPGTVTALVGPSGSGKSTLAALLARFYDVGGGSITIGGRDIRTMAGDELYRHLGFVLQSTQLVAGTVAENIALAVPEASRERVEAAARAANIHDRIERMPQGYDTFLGADAALSGGERQRLTIARALLADAPILVLDEATAFADPESEYLVQQSLSTLAADRTVLVIAHRLHTVVDADRIVVLDDGRIVETGTHAQLFEARGRYRALWDSLEGNSAGNPADTAAPDNGADLSMGAQR